MAESSSRSRAGCVGHGCDCKNRKHRSVDRLCNQNNKKNRKTEIKGKYESRRRLRHH